MSWSVGTLKCFKAVFSVAGGLSGGGGIPPLVYCSILRETLYSSVVTHLKGNQVKNRS